MLTDEWLTVIKMEREREIRAAQRARLAHHDKFDIEPGDTTSAVVDRAVGRVARPTAQPGRATADSSL